MTNDQGRRTNDEEPIGSFRPSSFVLRLRFILSSTLYLRLTWDLAGDRIIPVRCRTRSKLRCKVGGRATFSLLHEPGGSGSPPGFVFPATGFAISTSAFRKRCTVLHLIGRRLKSRRWGVPPTVPLRGRNHSQRPRRRTISRCSIGAISIAGQSDAKPCITPLDKLPLDSLAHLFYTPSWNLTLAHIHTIERTAAARRRCI